MPHSLPGPAAAHAATPNLSLVSINARFCPRCGLRLNDDRAAGEGDRHPWFARNTTSGHTEPSTAADRFTSTILRGYANAMYRLGVRYEVRRNEAEAVRCFGKASHLGNEPAKSRLLEIPIGTRAKLVRHTPGPS